MIKLVWAGAMTALSVAASAQVPAREDFIKGDTDLVIGKRYYSQDHTAFLIAQTDGNLVLYRFDVDGKKTIPLWNSGTGNTSTGNVGRTRLQNDGNLVIYYTTGGARWAANNSGRPFTTATGAVSVWLQVQNDHNVVIYGGEYPHGAVSWSTGTQGR